MCNNTLNPSSPSSNNAQPQHKPVVEQVQEAVPVHQEQAVPVHQEEEYIDYSCSTAVERLTRDVESLLRTWHVGDGCDRHFSLSTNPNGLTLLRAERLTWIASLPHSSREGIRMELELALWDGPASQVPPSKSKKLRRRQSISTVSTTTTTTSCSSTTTATTTASTATGASVSTSKGGFFKSILDKSTKKKKKKTKSTKSSDKKKKKKGTSNRRSSLSNDECLEGTLNDIKEAVGMMQDDTTMDGSAHTTGTDFYGEDDDEEGDQHPHLPKSLQRPIHPVDATHLPDSLFDNFSTLFGIGQHITLTPTNPNIDLGINDDNDTDTNSNHNRLVHLCKSLLGRHNPAPAREVLTQVLATWLQTALNCAAMNCQSCIPVFGLWGQYPSASLPSSDDNENSSSNDGGGAVLHATQPLQQRASISVFPAWMDATCALQGPVKETASTLERDYKKASKAMSFSPRRKSKRRSSRAAMAAKEAGVLHAHVAEPWVQNSTYAPPILTGSVIPTTDTYANFTCSLLPQSLLPGCVDQLSTWGELLSRHCCNADMTYQNQPSVVLTGARHVYAWWKDNTPKAQAEAWRGMDPKDYWKGQQNQQWNRYALDSAVCPWTSSLTPPQSSQSSTLEEVQHYQSVCRAQALLLLEHSMGGNCWGPREDPIYAMHATVAWKSTNAPTIQPLGSFPSPTHYDSSSSLLNPKRASSFRLKTFVDHGALEPTLATTQRCVLACLVRASTLAPMTLLQHLLWEEDIVEDWDHEAGNRAAMEVARQARVGEATQTLVDVMDWMTCAEEMIEIEQAEKIVQEVLEGTASYAFPSPPEDMFSFNTSSSSSSSHPLLAPLFQSAPVGRLLSDLFSRMAQLRTPCSMALVWNTFCNELRQRWDAREPLPNMNFVPGLDPSPTVLSERRRKVSTIAVKADLSAFLFSSEADPDDQHCLIGQKLQVFNIGIEVMSSIETLKEQSFDEDETETSARQEEVDEQTYEFEKLNDCSSMPARATSVVSLVSEGMAAPSKEEPTLKSTTGGKIVNLSSLGSFRLPDDLFKGRNRNKELIDGLLPQDKRVQIDEEASIASDSMATDFFDAEECAMSIYSHASLFSKNLATTVVHRIERKGARCPLHGCSLVASGDQVYAPYLQRPEPITDDMILDRRMMLSEEQFASEGQEGGDGGASIQQRLEIAYRLQKPKLLSDMNAFKAANPGAIFQDFVSWYGNPGNPLEDYSDFSSSNVTDASQRTSHGGLAATESVSVNMDKATEAFYILNETREFWGRTWDEASTAIPASEQKPLFDAFSTVEITLDYLENMHPAILLSQVLAVNFTNAYFTLVASAKDTLNIKVVENSIQRLRTKTEEALEVLAKETSNATNAFYNMQADPGNSGANFISTNALCLCEEVCAAFGEAEIIIALATSILQKLPGQYDTAQNILRNAADGEDVELPHEESRGCVLDSIRKQQSYEGNLPDPVLREYLLRNLDDANPCQLSVRYGDTGVTNDPHQKGGLLIALTRTLGDC